MGNKISKKDKYKEVSKKIVDSNGNYYVWIKYYNDEYPILITSKDINLNPYYEIHIHDTEYPNYKIYNKIMDIKPEYIKPISNFILNYKIIDKINLYNIILDNMGGDIDKYLIIDKDRNIIKSKIIKNIINENIIKKIIDGIIINYLNNSEYCLLLPYNNNCDIYIQKIKNTNTYLLSKINV